MTETCRVPPACTANQGPPPDPCLSASLTLTALWPVADTGPLDISRTRFVPYSTWKGIPSTPQICRHPLEGSHVSGPWELGLPIPV